MALLLDFILLLGDSATGICCCPVTAALDLNLNLNLLLLMDAAVILCSPQTLPILRPYVGCWMLDSYCQSKLDRGITSIKGMLLYVDMLLYTEPVIWTSLSMEGTLVKVCLLVFSCIQRIC
ncbi:unnamed protein product [Cuscuta campestris]|uniref:Uncharacterized protein n=1 Tax=Cuscuta campestris TaxID=132261 RepID=A0A484LA40_9ASTE|nr:unnamed protein product [Cuscuta campestris]